jgi:hypothetical protein
MRHPILLLALLLLLASGNAQPPQRRLSVCEIFTGENHSTNYANIFQLFAAPTNTTRVIMINWEVPIHTAPTTTWSLYQTNKTEIDWRWGAASKGGYGYVSQNTPGHPIVEGISFAPYAILDGQQPWVFGAEESSAWYLDSTVFQNSSMQYTPFNILMQANWDSVYSSIDVTLTVHAISAFSHSANVALRTVMIERKIDFPIPPGLVLTHFENVAVRSYPGINGITLPSNWSANQTITYTLNCKLPTYIRDKSQISLVSFIQSDGDKMIHQAAVKHMVKLPMDLRANKVLIKNINCLNSVITPTLQIINTGSSVATGFTCTPSLNNKKLTPFVWSGTLLPGDTTIVALPSFTSALTLSGTNTLSCVLDSVAGGDMNIPNNSNYIHFQVLYNPFVYIAASPKVCVGKQLPFLPKGASTYTLFPGNLTGSSFTLFPTVTTTYTLMGEQGGCTATNVAIKTVTVFPTPVITASSGTLCLGNSTYLNASGADNFTVLTQNQPKKGLPVTPTTITTYTVYGTTAAGCASSNSPVVTVSVFALPLPKISVVAKQTACKGEAVKLSTSGADQYYYQNSPVSNTFSVIAVTNTVITITGRADQTGCVGQKTIALTVNPCLNTSESTMNADLRVFPNPSGGNISIYSEFAISELTLTDITGKHLSLQTEAQVNGTNSFNIRLSPGIYFLSVSGTSKKVIKVIVR